MSIGNQAFISEHEIALDRFEHAVALYNAGATLY